MNYPPVQNDSLNIRMTLKHYIVEDLSALTRLEAWVAVASNRTELFTAKYGDSVSYKVVVNDAQGMAAVSPAFESEFGDSVRASAFPE